MRKLLSGNSLIIDREIMLHQPIFKRLRALFKKEKTDLNKILLRLPVSLYWRIITLNVQIKKLFYYSVLPWLLFRKTFSIGPFDALTRIGSGISDVWLFTDPMEVKAHKILFKKSEIYVVQTPSSGNCRCKSHISKQNSILCPLQPFDYSDEISEEVLKLYLRDFRTVLKEMGNDVSIHLRPHPLYHGGYKLRDYLIANNIKAEVVESTKTIREEICKYLGIIGFSSASMREARSSCNYGFMIVFEALSKKRCNRHSHFIEPKFLYGLGEGIGWINEDGSYDPKIFERKKYVRPKRKAVQDIINELSEK